MSVDEKQWEIYQEILAEDGHDSADATNFDLKRTFAGVNFENARVLDVGSGRGLMTLYAALQGASKVISLEPEMDGATEGVFEMQKARAKRLGLDNIECLAEDFNTWEYDGESFDVILCFACINHLHETEHHAMYHEETLERFNEIAGKFRRLLKPNGVIIFTDAARYGLFWMLKAVGIRRPWQSRKSSINYRIHQNPSTWKKIFLNNGFSRGKVVYPLPYPLRFFGPLVANPVANFCLKAKFALQCHAGDIKE